MNHKTIRIDFCNDAEVHDAIVTLHFRDASSDVPVVAVVAPGSAFLPVCSYISDLATKVILGNELLDRDRVIWIDYQPEVPGLCDEEWELVTFTWRMEESGDETALVPTWLSITRDAADVICGGEVMVA